MNRLSYLKSSNGFEFLGSVRHFHHMAPYKILVQMTKMKTEDPNSHIENVGKCERNVGGSAKKLSPNKFGEPTMNTNKLYHHEP